jgi:hypothetical protein
MPAPPDAIVGLLTRVRVRLARRTILRAAATAAGMAAVLLFTGRLLDVGARVRLTTAAVFGAAVALRQWRREDTARTRRAAARAIERHEQGLKNLLVTAEELLADSGHVPGYMRARVFHVAAAAIERIDAARVVPLGTDAVILAIATLALVASRTTPGLRLHPSAGSPAAPVVAAGADVLEIEIAPPAYTRRPTERMRDPRSLAAIAGSSIAIRVPGVPHPDVRVNGTGLRADEDGTVRTRLAESGAVAVDGGRVHALLPLTVTPDAAPDVHVTVPGRDLRLTDANTPIAVHAAATDDIGLRSLEVRYTVVSGGGEEFTFKEGTLVPAVTRASERAWAADAVIPLAALKLEPGDALVYRAVAADARPDGAGEASSDTYYVEIAGPGDVPLDGVDMPPDRERYALSEAMIVLKLQRLIAQQAGLGRAAVEETASGIAAEQRAVRANFIFMLGGEVEDEVVEAEASHEIQEGRLANQARREIVAATVLMGKVEQALAAVAPRAALLPAQEAVRTLQRAFGHSRYLLRALPARIRVDPTRRLSGDVASIRDWRRDLVPATDDARTNAARAALADLLDIAPRLDAAAGGRLARLFEQVAALEPGAADLRQAAQRLIDARDALSRGDTVRARAAIADAAVPIVRRAGRGAVEARPVDADVARLAGAAAIAKGGVR